MMIQANNMDTHPLIASVMCRLITDGLLITINGHKPSHLNLMIIISLLFEPPHEKTNNLHMRKQRRRSASR